MTSIEAHVNPKATEALSADPFIDFQCDPGAYRHWRLSFAGPIATLALAVAEDGGLKPGYKLKLNSYDLGVDIELNDALQRIRFEHPEIRTVVLTSALERIFCSGANIYMLGLSSHGWKVNFCKFTNETRNSIEHSSRHSGLKFLAAVNGSCAGGGYEMALACDQILLVDDRSSSVSLPEVPLLGVLPGTGGLTRLTDKRRVRRDLADVFCTTQEGQRAERALAWRLIDGHAKPAEFATTVTQWALRLAEQSDRPQGATGVALRPLSRLIDAKGYHYRYVDVERDAPARVATITIRAPEETVAADIDTILAAGCDWFPLQWARELEDAILNLRTMDPEIGTWIFRSVGDAKRVLEADDAVRAHRSHWFVREVRNLQERSLSRLDVSSRSMIALIDRHSCFAGSFLELALAADRSYMLDLPDGPGPSITLGPSNFDGFAQITGQSRLAGRFGGDEAILARLREQIGTPLDAPAALAAGLVTFTPDDLDWPEEIRLAVEERASLSPDALTGLEASLRFPGPETMYTRIFARLSAWQNWIFIRPNAVGEHGALKIFGTGKRAQFDWKRV